MILITGDTHGSPKTFQELKYNSCKLGEGDYLLICGDFGFVFAKDEENKTEKYWMNWLATKPWTTLFVDGNHENFDRLNAMPVEDWCGGKVHKIRHNVIHLMRGYVFNIDGKSIFSFGGAASHDIQDGVLEIGDPRIKEWKKNPYKLYRVNHLEWWKEEMPSEEEMELGLKNLAAVDFKVDYIVTHSPSTMEQVLLDPYGHFYEPDALTEYLEKVKSMTEYKKHFFGHMHIDKAINEKDECLFEKAIPIDYSEYYKTIFGGN